MPNIKLFEEKRIRSVWNEKDQKQYFSVIDVVEALTDSVNPKDYIKKMRKRDILLNSNWGTICPSLETVTFCNALKKKHMSNIELFEKKQIRSAVWNEKDQKMVLLSYRCNRSIN